MIKLPEPDLSFDNGVEAHSEAQLKRAVRAALEDAAKVAEDTVTALCGLPDVARLIALGDDIASNIRKLKEAT